MIEEEVEVDPLRGFWKAENSIPSRVTLIKGDRRQFRLDQKRCRERIVKYIKALEEDRFLLMYSVPDALLGMTTYEDWEHVRNCNLNSTRRQR